MARFNPKPSIIVTVSPRPKMSNKHSFTRSILCTLVWICLSITPEWGVHPQYATVFTTRLIFVSLFSAISFKFAPGLLEALISTTPPGLDFFKNLPTTTQKVWAIYALLLEKHDEKPLIYIGSGTSAEYGVQARLGQYHRGEKLARLVRAALADGYSITHIGLLCIAPRPPSIFVGCMRLMFLALEATLTFFFKANCRPRKGDPDVTQLCPWETVP